MLIYSPRGTEPLSERSRTHVRALVKSGNVRVMEMAADRIKDRNLFPGYFGAGFLRVPVPGHAPMRTPTVWPAATIAEALVSREPKWDDDSVSVTALSGGLAPVAGGRLTSCGGAGILAA